MIKKKEKIKVMLLIDNHNLGGAQKFTLNLCKFLNKNEFEVHVVFWKEGFFTKDFEKIQNIFLHPLNIAPASNAGIFEKMKIFLKHMAEIKKKIKNIRPNILQTTLPTSDFYGMLMKILNPKIKFISRKADTPLVWKKKFFLHLFLRFYFKFHSFFVNKFVCISFAVKDYMNKYEFISRKKLKVIHNGVNLADYQEKNKNYNLINFVYLGRLDIKHKRLDLILKAAQILMKKYRKKFNLFIIGDGKDRELIEKICRKNPEHMKFLGKRKNINASLEKKHILLSPSKWEAFGIANIEAMACGLPVIATRVGGLSEIIVDKETGFLIEKNNAAYLAEKMEYFLLNKEMIEKMGKKARERVIEKFDIRQQVKEYENVYLNV